MKNLKNRRQLVSYIYGIMNVMNRQKKTVITETILMLFPVDIARERWDIDRISSFINDMLILLEENQYHQEYWNLFFFVQQHIGVYKNEIID